MWVRIIIVTILIIGFNSPTVISSTVVSNCIIWSCLKTKIFSDVDPLKGNLIKWGPWSNVYQLWGPWHRKVENHRHWCHLNLCLMWLKVGPYSILFKYLYAWDTSSVEVTFSVTHVCGCQESVTAGAEQHTPETKTGHGTMFCGFLWNNSSATFLTTALGRWIKDTHKHTLTHASPCSPQL